MREQRAPAGPARAGRCVGEPGARSPMLDGARMTTLASAPGLFPPHEERERWDDLLTRGLLAADERVADGSVMPTLDFAAFRQELAEFDFAERRPMAELSSWVIDQLE